MLTAVAVLASLGFIGWLIYRAVRHRHFMAHDISRGLAYIAGIYTFAFFLDMDSIDRLVKILVSILLGIALIILAALLQRRKANR